MGRGSRQGRNVGERARTVAALLATVLVLVLGACGNDLEVVPPEQPAASTPASAAGASQVAGGTATTSTIPATPTSTAPLGTSTTLAPTSSTTSTTVQVDPLEAAAEESVAFVNAKRADAGLPALEVDADLVAMARDWAETIAGDQDLRHNPDLAGQAPDRYTTLGENVGYAPSAAAMDQAWWDSDGHRENILRPSFQAIGIAFVVDADGTWWGVQVFGGA